MKNKIFLIIFLLFLANICTANEFNFEAENITILKDGNVIEAREGVKITDKDKKITILGDKFIYDKINSILEINGNVELTDTLNKIIIKSNQITYFEKEEKIITTGKSFFEIENEYFIETKNLVFLRLKKNLKSNNKTEIQDEIGNKIFLNKFNYKILEKTIIGNSISYLDISKNNYFFNDGIIDLETGSILGKDLNIDFFTKNKNEPRLKGKSVIHSKDKTIVAKGVFTTCKKRDGCPPWTLSASEISHDKKKKIINYKNAWLKVYDTPVFYFPKFFHPDPTVKRQSGFLIPGYSDSNTLGSSLNIPYYKVISDNQDLTFKPRFYSKNNLILQSEYRYVDKNSKHTLDFSLNKKNKLTNLDNKSASNTHFFSKSIFDLDIQNFDESELELNLEHTSNDTYLKTYSINSPLINSASSLNSYLDFSLYNDEYSIESTVSVYENLDKTSSDRHEYIFPSVNLRKNLKHNFTTNGELLYKLNGYQKKYDTNVYDAVVINDLLFQSTSIFSSNGLQSKYDLLLKNVNTNSDNSSKYKNDLNSQLLTTALYETRYPLKKEGSKFDDYITPILSLRFSPNNTKNIKDADRRVDINNIYSLNRIGSDDAVEGGLAITLGNEYVKKNKNDMDIFSLNLATSFRNKENKDLPIKSTIGKKTSDIVGNLNFKPSNIMELEYNFSYDNDLSESNYDAIKTKFSVNNFVTSFEFIEEKNYIGSESYIQNKTQFYFSDNNSLNFSTRKNKKTDLTEFYNLIYEYKNDCLVAGIEYNKEYYTDNDLKPEERLFFSLTIVPFGKTTSPNLNK